MLDTPDLSPFGTPPTADWPTDATRDRFCGPWHLWQRRRGHRTSTDDMLTAWLATRVHPHPPSRYLDLGCGIGSVLLLTAHALRPALSIGVEAQPQSATMAARTVAELPPDAPPLHIRLGDLRNLDPARLPRFPLITSSPPYFPIGTGVPSPDPQRTACRFEIRGGIEDYCAAAAPLLTPAGLLITVFQSTWHPRVLSAANQAGLNLHHLTRLHTREDNPTDFLRVYAFTPTPRPQGTPAGTPDLPTTRQDSSIPHELCVRHPDGSLTDEWQEVRRVLGLVL